MPELHVVVGAGSVGGATAALLAQRGHRVRVVSRSGRALTGAAGTAAATGTVGSISSVAADAGDAARMKSLAEGATAIYNCANPAYHRWPTDWPPIAASLLAAAEHSGAVLATVSNMYGYGPATGPIDESHPLAATGAKAGVRIRMWRDALAAHEAGRVRVTEVRGSDYVGPRAESHLGERVVPRLLAGKGVRVLGSADAPHSWTYPPDVARLLVTVAADRRGWGRAWHVPSNPPRTQREAIDDLARVAGVGSVPVGVLPHAVLRMLGIFSPTIRELEETRYQFTGPWLLDSAAATETFGLTATPWEDALRATLRSYGWQGA